MNVVVDTNVLSEARRAGGNARVKGFLASQDHVFYVSVITMGEVAIGIEGTSDPVKRASLARWLIQLQLTFVDTMLPVGLDEALLWGRLTGSTRLNGITIPPGDGLIAATAMHHGMVVATRNVQHFAAVGVPVVNPWDPSA